MSRMITLWVILASTLSIAVVAFDIGILRRNTIPDRSQLNVWRTKRLNEMACHCCSNSFNSHCCLQCMQHRLRIGKRVLPNNAVPSSTNDLLKNYPSEDSWNLESFPNNLDTSFNVEDSDRSPIPPNKPTEMASIFLGDILERSRACACCLQGLQSDLMVDNEISCCMKCRGSHSKQLPLDYY